MVAGVMENVTQRWKTISFPINFPTTPLVFSQVISYNEVEAVIPRVRNISSSQFELKLQEEEKSVTGHMEEKVAWIAIEAGINAGMKTGAALFGYLPEEANNDAWPADYFFETPIEITNFIQNL